MSQLIAEFGDCKLYEVPATSTKDGIELPKGMKHVEVRKKTEGEEEQIYRSEFIFPQSLVTSSPGVYVDESFEVWLRESIKYRPSDIIITTFPKCGTTFMEQIVLLLLNEGDVEKLDPLSKNSYHLSKSKVGKVWPEGSVVPNDYTKQYAPGRPPYEEFFTLSLDDFESMPNPRVIKSHASIHHILGGRPRTTTTTTTGNDPKESSSPVMVQLAPAKYIVVTRNIFDACVSSYYHAFNPHEQGWPFDAWALMFLEGYSEPSCGGSYFDWNKGWKELEKLSDGSQILWIHYEDLLRSTRENVIRIAKFIGVDPTTPNLIDRVIEGSSFSKMKAKADERKMVDCENYRKMTSGHMRKGKAGDWRNYFTKDLEELFRQRYKEKMGNSGLCYSLGNDQVLE